MAFNPLPELSTGTFGATVVKAAYDRYFEMALRHAPILREIADKRPVQVDKPSSTITLSTHADLAVVTGTLAENTDVTPATFPPATPITITLAERGNAVLETRLLREFSMTDVDPYLANVVAYNMRDSLDYQFQQVLIGGTNVLRGGGVAGTVNLLQASEATHHLTSTDIRTLRTRLVSNAAVPKRDDLYGAYVHPDVSFDIKSDSGAGTWREPHVYTSPDNIWKHVVGVYEGFYFVESARMYTALDGGSSAKVYRSIFCGQQAMAEAEAVTPQLVASGKVGADLLSRLYTLGWYSVLGWSIFRQAALYRGEHVSTIN